MKKRILALVLSVAMVLGAVSFTAFADTPAADPYAAGEGAYYLFDVPDADIAAENHTTTGVTGALPVINENGENFVNLNNLYPVDAEGKASSADVKINAANLTYGAAGVPASVVIGDNNAETTEDLKTTYIALRIKINDNSPAYGRLASALRLYLGKSDNTFTDLQMTTTEKGRHASRWLDLNDGSLTYFWGQSGYSRLSILDRYEFTGDMDGYMFIPFTYSASSESTYNMITDADLRDVFSSISIHFVNAAKDENHKGSSWQDKQVLLGDAFIVNDIEKFAAARSEKRGVAGQMYRPNVEDTAAYAMRVGGYRSTAFLRGARSVSKALNDPDVYGYSGNYDTFYHVTTLPNGDRAYEFVVNYDEAIKWDKDTKEPIEWTKNGDVYLPICDTYDGNNLDAKGFLMSKAAIGGDKQGVPSVIDLSKAEYIAYRIATKDGTVANEPVAFNINMILSKSVGSTSIVTCKLGAGDITYLDLSTGKTEKITVGSDGLISLTKNVDGYLIIPIAQYGDKFTADTIQTTWGGVFPSNQYARAIQLYMPDGHGWANGKALYSGDVFFVEDAKKFTDYHCPHSAWTKGTTVEPTCKAGGYTPYTCDGCGKTENRDETAIIPCDTKGGELQAKAPTCKEEGFSAAKKCSMCGEISEKSAPIAVIPCDTKVDYPAKPATCKEPGNEAGKKCSMCGEITEGGATLVPVAHDKLGGDVAAKPATCKEAGNEAGKKCSMCGEISEGGATIAIIAHDKNTEIKEIPATCKEKGTTAGKACSMCGEVQEGCEEIPVVAHNKDKDVAEVPATCTKEGTTAGKACSMCGEVQEGCEEIDMIDHELETIETVKPTATEKGYDVLKCKNCDYTEEDNFVDELGETEAPDAGENNFFAVVMMIVALGAATVLFATKKRARR